MSKPATKAKPVPPDAPKLFTLAEVCEVLKISDGKLLKLMAKYEIPYLDVSGLKPGEPGRRQYRVAQSEVDELLDKMRRVPRDPDAKPEEIEKKREIIGKRNVKPVHIPW